MEREIEGYSANYKQQINTFINYVTKAITIKFMTK
jgi:hypothetical protein